MKNSIYSILSIIVLCFSSCTVGEHYNQENLYLNYLNELGFELGDETNILIVSYKMCHPCVKESFNTLNNIKNKKTVSILIGYSSYDIQQLKQEYQNIVFIRDSKKLVRNIKYKNIDYPNPVFLHFKEEQLVHIEFVKANVLDKSIDAIESCMQNP